MELRFFYNGIKGTDKKLQKAFYSRGSLRGYREGTITIYARGYTRFSNEIKKHFTVENDTDTRTDYFDSDKIRVTPEHKLFSLVNEAYTKQENKRKK